MKLSQKGEFTKWKGILLITIFYLKLNPYKDFKILPENGNYLLKTGRNGKVNRSYVGIKKFDRYFGSFLHNMCFVLFCFFRIPILQNMPRIMFDNSK